MNRKNIKIEKKEKQKKGTLIGNYEKPLDFYVK